MGRRASFGTIRRLPSKRWQASYVGPDVARHKAPATFTAKIDAEAWLVDERRLMETGEWTPPARRHERDHAAPSGPRTVGEFAEQWIGDLTLRPATRRDYESLLGNHIIPALGTIPLVALDKATVRRWWTSLDPKKPRARSKAFQLLHNIMNGAVELDLIPVNPVQLPKRTTIRTKRAKQIEPLSLDELAQIEAEMPAQYRLTIPLGCYCQLRYGELSELRRSDVDLPAGLLKISRGVIKVTGGYQVGPPKTAAGVRTVHIPPHLIPQVQEHLARYAGWGADGLLFPAANGGHLHSTTFARMFRVAATVAGRPDATPHLLRHTGTSLAMRAAQGHMAAVMKRDGHTTPSMTMLYDHAFLNEDQELAAELSRMVQGER